jgi:group I intron endonuclease
MDKGHIYCLTSPSGKRYIGQAVQILSSGRKYGYIGRWKGHINEVKNNRNYCRALNNAIRKYGHETFEVELLEICLIDIIDERENYYITKLKSFHPDGYNLITGKTNSRQSLETKELRRKSMIGKNKGNVYPRIDRKREEDKDLPKYVRSYHDHTGKSGYRISHHPSFKDKSFVSKKISMKEKLCLALNYIRLDTNISVQRLNGNGLEENNQSSMIA